MEQVNRITLDAEINSDGSRKGTIVNNSVKTVTVIQWLLGYRWSPDQRVFYDFGCCIYLWAVGQTAKNVGQVTNDNRKRSIVKRRFTFINN